MNQYQANEDHNDVVQAVVVNEPGSGIRADRTGWKLLYFPLVLILAVVVCDLTLYNGHGYTGIGVFLITAPLIIALGKIQSMPSLAGLRKENRVSMSTMIVALMLLLIGLRMIWSGSILQVLVGSSLVFCFSLVIAGYPPLVLFVVELAITTVISGLMRLIGYCVDLNKRSTRWQRFTVVGIALPLMAVLLFGIIFIMANPDLRDQLVNKCWHFISDAWSWLSELMENPIPHIAFWGLVILMSAGLIDPVFFITITNNRKAKLKAQQWLGSQKPTPQINNPSPFGSRSAYEPPELPDSHRPQGAHISPMDEIPAEENKLFAAYRNTMVCVIVLFAVYFVYEFATLWFREFPVGFYYSGYAHQGAAWLTVALALATVILSLVFSGDVLRHPKIKQLRMLAWIWSFENIILAIAVINRLWIYIGFNGMTQMRIVAFFGIAAVVLGFILVVWKIAAGRDFVWLVHRQLLALFAVVFFYTVIPVDAIWTSYDVARILDGDLAPSVQISEHPMNWDGTTMLVGIDRCEDPVIRDGILAILAKRELELQADIEYAQRNGWTAWQGSRRRAYDILQANSKKWAEYSADEEARNLAIKRFHDYSYKKWW